MLEIIAEIGWDSALRPYGIRRRRWDVLHKEGDDGTALSSNLESCVTTRTVDILRFQPSPRLRGFSRESGKGGAEEEEENQDFCKDRGWSPLPRNFVAEFQRKYREAWLHRICARRYGVHYALEKACNIICMPFACDLHIIFNERTRSSRFLLPMEKTTISPPVENVRFVDPSNRFRNTHEIGFRINDK